MILGVVWLHGCGCVPRGVSQQTAAKLLYSLLVVVVIGQGYKPHALHSQKAGVRLLIN